MQSVVKSVHVKKVDINVKIVFLNQVHVQHHSLRYITNKRDWCKSSMQFLYFEK